MIPVHQMILACLGLRRQSQAARALIRVVLVTTCGIPSTVQAQDVETTAPRLKLNVTLTAAHSTARTAEEQAAAPLAVSRPTMDVRDASRTADVALRSLYITTATVQMLDVHSTVKAMSRGAVETNPLLSGLVQHRGAFLAAKAGVAAVTIYTATRLARHNKAAAIVTMIAVNSACAMIVANNYRNAAR